MASYLVGKLLERATRANYNMQPQQGNTASYGTPPAQQYGQTAPARNGMFNPYTSYEGSYGQQSSPNYQPARDQSSSSNSPYGPNSQSQPTVSMHNPISQNSARITNPYQPPQPQASAQLGPEFWGALITSQKTASPSLVAYVTSLYSYLDQTITPTNQGGLSPEKIGLLGELQGYYGDAGLYGQMKTEGSNSGQGVALIDAKFTMVYNSYSLPYNTVLRAATPSPPAATTAAAYLGSFLAPQVSSMPLLTLDGLLTWTVLNILRQPHQEWVCMSKLLSSTQLVHPQNGMLLPRSIGRGAFPEREDGDAVRRNAMCEDNMRRKNEGDARNLAMAARNSDNLAARMRDDAVWGYEVNGQTRYWL